MAATQIIGKVAVKVIPDTSDFREQAKAALEKEERRLGKLKVSLVVDETGLRSAILKTIRELNKDIKGKSIYAVKFPAAISDQGMRSEVSRAARELNALSKLKDVKFKVNLDDIKGVVDVTLDISDKEKDRVARELKDWANDISPLKVGVVPEFVNGSGTLVAARLAILTRPRTVEIIPKINNSALAVAAATLAALSGFRVLSDSIDSVWQRLKNLDKSVPIIGSVAEAVLGLTGFLLTSASNAFALAQSLAQIGPAALLLPGIFGGMLVGAGATFAVLKDFNEIFPEISKSLSKLQDQMSENFWGVAEGPIRNMIDVLLPLFSESLRETATELGGFFAGLATSLETTFAPVLTSMFDGLHESIAIAATGTEAYAGIMATLGQVGASYLPRLAQWWVDINERFNDFVSSAAADGRLTGWIETALDNLSALGSVVVNFGGILAGLSQAASAAGGSSLQMLATTLEAVNEQVNSEAFQTTLVAVLTAAHEAMTRISNISGDAFGDFFQTLSDLLTRLLPIVGTTLGTAFDAILKGLSQPAVSKGIIDLFLGIQSAVRDLAPAMMPLGKAIGDLLSLIGTFAAELGPLFAVAIGVAAPLLSALIPPLKSIVKLLGGGLLTILKAVSGPLLALGQTLATVFSDTLVPALTPVIDGIARLGAEVLPIVVNGVGKLLVALGPLIERIGALLAFLIPVLIPVLKLLAETLISSLVMAIDGIVQAIDGVVAIIQGLVDFVVGVFTGDWARAWDGVKQIFSGLWGAIIGIFKVALNIGVLAVFRRAFLLFKSAFVLGWNGIKAFFIAVWEIIRARWSEFLTAFVKAPGTAFALLKQFFKRVWDDLKFLVQIALDAILWYFCNTWGRVIDVVKAIPGAIKAVFTDAPSILKDIGKKIIDGLINGIKAKFGDVKDTLSGLTKKITDWKGPASLDAVLLTPAGQMIIDGLIEGLESRYDAVRKSLSSLTDDIAKTEVTTPLIAALSGGGKISSRIEANLSGEVGGGRTFIYQAAAGNSLSSEEDLFLAVERGRMVGW